MSYQRSYNRSDPNSRRRNMNNRVQNERASRNTSSRNYHSGSQRTSKYSSSQNRRGTTSEGSSKTPANTSSSRRQNSNFNSSSRYSRGSQSLNARQSKTDVRRNATNRSEATRNRNSSTRTVRTSTPQLSRRNSDKRYSYDASYGIDGTSALSTQNSRRSPSGTVFSKFIGVLQAIYQGFVWIFRKSKIAFAIVIAIILSCGWLLVDSVVTNGKIYSGVHIGSVDVSGMTAEQATSAVNSMYNSNLYATNAYIFANEELAQSSDIPNQMLDPVTSPEQISFEDAQKAKELWITNAATLGGSIPTEDLVEQAMQVGREWRMLDRLGAQLFTCSVPMRVNYNEDALDSLLIDIDSSIGVIMKNFDIEVKDGQASVIAGNDGDMVDKDKFISELSDALLANSEERATLVATTEHKPMQIDEATAKVTCDAVNELLGEGASFLFDGNTLDASRSMIGGWVKTSVEEKDGKYFLSPYFDVDSAYGSLATHINDTAEDSGVNFTFQVDNNDIVVHMSDDVTVPDVNDSISQLNKCIFGSFNNSGNVEVVGSPYNIPILTETKSGPFSLDDACMYGIVSEMASYTTYYTNSSSAENRNFNIHRAADAINNSVATANGGQWAFNEITGDCNEEAGYKKATVIIEDQLEDSAGGGICQVASTVFNAVYEAGLPVIERHNHTLQMASYPDGRDAAVSFGTLDLRWKNETGSDILLQTSHTDTSVTVSLFGPSLDYSVKTETGDWEEGDKYRIKVKEDETLAEGVSYVKTAGVDGKEIKVVRTVTDENGDMVLQDAFYSVYSPVDEIIVAGPNTEVDTRHPEDKKDDDEDQEDVSDSSTEASTT